MGAERQQGRFYQRFLFEEEPEDRRPGAGGEGGTGPAAHEEPQTSTASKRKRALTVPVCTVTTAEETAGYEHVRPVV